MRARVIDKRSGAAGSISFEAMSKTPITEEEAQDAQRELGYDPNGYDFYGFVTELTPDGYYARWRCYNSCE